MFAVYFTGCTDSFLQAIFQDRDEAVLWAESQGRGPGYSDGDYHLEEWTHPSHIDISDTGWDGGILEFIGEQNDS